MAIFVLWDIKSVFYTIWQPLDWLVGYTDPRKGAQDRLHGETNRPQGASSWNHGSPELSSRALHGCACHESSVPIHGWQLCLKIMYSHSAWHTKPIVTQLLLIQYKEMSSVGMPFGGGGGGVKL